MTAKKKKKKTKIVDADDKKNFAEEFNKRMPGYIKKQIKKNPGGHVL